MKMETVSKNIEFLIKKIWKESKCRNGINIVLVSLYGGQNLAAIPCFKQPIRDGKNTIKCLLNINNEFLYTQNTLYDNLLSSNRWDLAANLLKEALFLPNDLINVIQTYVEIHPVPFVCELNNAIWQPHWIIDLLPHLTDVIVWGPLEDTHSYISRKPVEAISRDFIRTLYDLHPSKKIGMHHAVSVRRVGLRYDIPVSYPQHTCRSCVKWIEEITKALRCHCPYYYFCSIQCRNAYSSHPGNKKHVQTCLPSKTT